uniref:Uncharacterized protein n=1 Tax=Timema douglasi TaxID=61478 RepID=A0A7R8VWL3_TIMDO|nr:unnamed protein product [Timema douglasi]
MFMFRASLDLKLIFLDASSIKKALLTLKTLPVAPLRGWETQSDKSHGGNQSKYTPLTLKGSNLIP